MKRARRPADGRAVARKLRERHRAGVARLSRESSGGIHARGGIYLDTAKLLTDIRGTVANEAKRLRDLQRLRRVTEKFVAESARFRPMFARPFPYKVTDCSRLADDRAGHRAEFLPRTLSCDRGRESTARGDRHGARQPRRRGRPAADDLGLLAQIAGSWRELFDERPTATPGGKFANVATLVLENLHGRPPRDVSRHVAPP